MSGQTGRRRPIREYAGRGRDEPASRDRWMVSYADFITVLFAFFVVLFASLGAHRYSIVKVSQSIQRGFLGRKPSSGNATAPGLADPPVTHRATARPAPALPIPEPVAGTHDATDATGIDLALLRRQLQAAIGAELSNGEVTMSVTSEGFVISLKEVGFFPSGQAVLRPGAAAKIERIAKILAQHGFYLRVEGNSDNQPIHNAEFHSNWELSTARAMEVLMLLVHRSNLNPGKLSLAGYGPYRPVASNATPEGRRLNRRVDLVVVAGLKNRG